MTNAEPHQTDPAACGPLQTPSGGAEGPPEPSGASQGPGTPTDAPSGRTAGPDATARPTTPAGELAAAATLLRQRAEAATPGPWRLGNIGDFGWTVECGGGPWFETEDSDEGRAQGAYIAAVHPGVGLALAAWLESAARFHEAGVRAADDVFADDPAGRDAFLATGPGAPDPHALAVARQLLAAVPHRPADTPNPQGDTT